jgi:hypothetical protein
VSHPTSVETANEGNGWYPTQSPPVPAGSPWSNCLDSLLRRIRGMHALWLEALATMGPEHVNHVERDGVLPIAFTVNHMARMEDFARAVLSGTPALWSTEGWAAKVGIVVDDIGKNTTVEQMMQQRVGDYDALVEFTRQTFAATEKWLDELAPDDLGEVLFGGTFPADAQNAYVHRVVRGEQILRVDGVECWIYQHGIRHLGELEHARALVGLGGMTS